ASSNGCSNGSRGGLCSPSMLASWADFTDFLTALSKFAWPILVAVLLWRLSPAIKRVIESRGYTVKLPGGVEISVQQAADEERRLITDVAKRVTDLERRQKDLVDRLEAGVSAAVEPLRGVETIAPDSGEAATVYVKITPSGEEEVPRQVKQLLWIGPP